MMRFVNVLFFFLLAHLTMAQQQQLQHHVVQPGETVYSIARSYGMTVDAFYDLNPETKEVLREGGRVMVHVPQSAVPIDSTRFHFHTVKPGETIYSLSKRYDVNEDILLEHNPDLKERGLKTDMVIKIPKAPRRSPIVETLASDDEQKIQADEEGFLMHNVSAGETIFSLTRKYNITAGELVERNPVLSEGLKEGQRLKIRPLTSTEMQIKEDVKVSATTSDSTRQPFTLYRIKEGDRLADIYEKFDVSYRDLERFNPRIQEGLRPGRMLLIPLSPTKDEVIRRDTSVYALDRVYPKGRVVNVALFLPLDIDVDNTKVGFEKQWVKQNEVSLGFYSGVKTALDSLQTLGIPSRVLVFNDKNISDDIVRGLDSVDIVIGPVFHRELEKLHNSMNRLEVSALVVSPMSRETDILNIPNIYQCVPLKEKENASMARLINAQFSKNPVIILHENTDGYKKITNNFLSTLNDTNVTLRKGSADRSALVTLLGEENDSVKKVVVLFGDELSYVASILNVLGGLRRSDVILISGSDLIKNPTVDLNNLGRLNFIRPESTHDNFNHQGTLDFYRLYRRNFNREPDRYAKQGFDVTWFFVGKIWGRDDQQQPVQQYFSFEKLPNGSFQNTDFIWIALDKRINQRVIMPMQ